jgi:hypothetical protein
MSNQCLVVLGWRRRSLYGYFILAVALGKIEGLLQWIKT